MKSNGSFHLSGLCRSLRLSLRWLSSVIIPFLLGSAGATPVESAGLRDPRIPPEGVAGSDWQGIRAAHEAWRHSFHRVNSGWEARNPGQQWTTAFDQRGFLILPRNGEWTWGLELQSYGFGGNQRPTSSAAEAKAEGQHLAYRWNDTVEEWFVNDQRGLEHGFTVKQRPSHSGRMDQTELGFNLKVRGALQYRIGADGQSVSFHDDSGLTVLNYAGLEVRDARGVILPSHFETAEQPGVFRLLVQEDGAQYPVTIDPVVQRAFLKPAAVGTTQAGDEFGVAVSISGNTVVVGAHRESSSSTGINSVPNENSRFSGAAYVFVRSGSGNGVWTQQAYLKAATNAKYDYFGLAVSVSGDTIAVGTATTQGALTGRLTAGVYIFARSAGVWTQQACLEGSHVQLDDRFGGSLALSGDTLVVGALLDSYATTGVNGIPAGTASNSGGAYIFGRSGGVWTEQAWLKASNTGMNDRFGLAVAVSGDTVVVGAAEESSGATGVNPPPDELQEGAGAAYVFVRSAGIWAQQAFLKPDKTGRYYRFGNSVGVSGDTIVIGEPGEDSPFGLNSPTGAAYIFARSAGAWKQQAFLKNANPHQADQFGFAVAISGDIVLVGNPGDEDSGAVYTFRRSGGTWIPHAVLKPGGTPGLNAFGRAVSVSGDYAVVGMPDEDSSSTGVNALRNQLSKDSGAAVIFNGLVSSLPSPELDAWRQLYFGTVVDTGNAASLFDADGDGIPNLVEYGFGLDPTSSASGELPAVQVMDGTLTVTFTQPAGVTGITYGIQWSVSMLPGSWFALPDTGSGSVHTFTAPAGAGDKVFLRFTVTGP